MKTQPSEQAKINWKAKISHLSRTTHFQIVNGNDSNVGFFLKYIF